jgi:hypothetical protein
MTRPISLLARAHTPLLQICRFDREYYTKKQGDAPMRFVCFGDVPAASSAMD